MAFLKLHTGYYGPVCIDFALCLFVLLVNDWLITKNIFTSARVPEYGLPVASSFVLVWTLVAS